MGGLVQAGWLGKRRHQAVGGNVDGWPHVVVALLRRHGLRMVHAHLQVPILAGRICWSDLVGAGLQLAPARVDELLTSLMLPWSQSPGQCAAILILGARP